MAQERISWNQYFMLQAILLSLRSTCTRLAVGAILVRDNRIIAGGYNGSVSGDVHCVRTIHAEMNAVLQCAKFGSGTDGAVIYVTDFPCLQCTKMLLQAGIKKIYYLRNYHNNPYAVKLLKLKNVEIEQVEVDLENLDAVLRKIEPDE